MKKVIIISSSVRAGDRMSHRVALYFKKYIEDKQLAEVELLDLKAYNFPLFEERFAFLKNPSDKLIEFTEKFKQADGVLIVSPIYNSSFPAALKNVMDLYYKEWNRKVAAVVSVTFGATPPLSTARELQTILLQLGALVVPNIQAITEASKEFKENGEAILTERRKKNIDLFFEDFIWILNSIKD